LADVTPAHAEAIFQALEQKAYSEVLAEGMRPEDARLSRELDLRYTGQGYELRTSLDGLCEGALDLQAMANARARFDERHAQIHGHAAKERSVEVVSYRLRVRVAVPKYEPKAEAAPAQPRPVHAAIKGQRNIYFDGETAESASVYERDGLDIGVRVAGPCVIEQFDATTIVPPHWSARVDQFRNLILERGVA
jgi:N-methylhydantoinase A/oxoprolinase/acetone carboxylase beta subunit